MKRIYLDWAATALPDETIVNNAAASALEHFGNPSSPHGTGREANTYIAAERLKIAASIGTDPAKLILTSGGTESNNIVLTSLLNKPRKGNIVISGIEHAAVYEPAMMLEKHGWEVRTVNPGSDGRITAKRFCSRIDENTRMAAVIMVNNETGAVQPVTEIGATVRAADTKNLIHFHVDAVQAAGKYPLNLDKMPIDSAALSSHKFRGPRGTGLLYLNRQIVPLYAGGGQEQGLRHGTENTFGLAGTAAALRGAVSAMDENLAHALKLKTILIDRLSEIRGVRFNTADRSLLLNPEIYSPYILSVSIKPVPGEILVRVISDRGFDIATGSACATGKKKKSRVMEAMGINSEDAFSTVRISTGPTNTIEEINRFCDTFVRESSILIKNLRR
ncbi:MAG: cysteine desulfurase family protein [Spirochaetales bacterium]|uniref:Cysteine desulfurase family protein n=1 Tax=Candidatus Thalassospirochaeta sargassi TaxID=3119039 RepID=A0AAJ1MJ76_9SPIO|nr:cysteine desulfurase family protein [Spirochaetales bacterium]